MLACSSPFFDLKIKFSIPFGLNISNCLNLFEVKLSNTYEYFDVVIQLCIGNPKPIFFLYIIFWANIFPLLFLATILFLKL